MINAFLSCFFLILCFPSLLFGLEVRFKNEVVVHGPVVTLAEVATIRPVSKAEILSDLVLFPSPSPGQKRCFSSSVFKAYVLDAVINKDSLRWLGAETVCIRHEGRRIGNGKILSVINAELQKALQHLAATEVSFEIRSMPEPLSLPSGKVEFDVLFSNTDILKSRQVNVIIKVDKKPLENLTIAGRVHALVPVVVINENLSRGTVLRKDHFRTEIKNIAELREPVFNPGDIIGKKLKRSVAINHVLSENDLEKPVLVQRRQVVTMILQKGGLQISTRGTATTDGKLGDTVMIKNISSRKAVPCRVIAPGLARVEF